MYKEILRGIENIEIWPVISFSIFFLFFIIMLLWVFTVDKKFINQMSQLPLSDDDGSDNTKDSTPAKQ